MYNMSVLPLPDGTFRVRYYDKCIFHENMKDCYYPKKFTEPFEGTLVTLLDDIDPVSKREESLRCSVSRTRRRIYNIAISVDWKYFVTFTFSPQKVDRYSYSDVSKVMGLFLDNLRMLKPNIQYLLVPELHKDGAYHFHGLFNDNLPVDYAGFFHHQDVFHVRDFDFGFTDCTLVESTVRISRYITKYITKDLVAVPFCKKRYWYSRSTIELVKPLQFFINLAGFKDFLRRKKDETIFKFKVSDGYISFSDYYITDIFWDDFVPLGFDCS